MSNTTIRLILVDDHALVRESWKILLQNSGDFEVVADTAKAADALSLVSELKPDVVLMDINMVPVNGFILTEQLIAQMPVLKIIGLSIHNQPGYALRMLEAGGRGFLTKTSSLEEITHAIRLVVRGEIYICKEVRMNMIEP